MAVLPLHRRPADTPRPGGLRRNLRRMVGLAATVLVAGGLLAAPAQADPSVEEIEAQITEQWHKLEPTVEDYNRVRSQLKANREKAKKLEKRMQPLELQSELAMGRINTIAARYYMTGTGSSTAYRRRRFVAGYEGRGRREEPARLLHALRGEGSLRPEGRRESGDRQRRHRTGW